MTAAPPPGPPIGLERPHGLGDVMRVAWRTMRARYGLYLLVFLLPAVAGLALLVVLGLLVGFLVLPTLSAGGFTGGGPAPGPLVVIGLVAVLGYLALIVLSARVGGMQTVLTRHTLEGSRPGLGQLWRETRGYVGRMLVLLLLGLALGVVVSVVFGLFSGGMATSWVGLARGDSPGGAAVLPLVGFWVVYLVFYVALIWLSVRLTPVTVVVGLERRGGMAALRRSWRLTDGHFWRTLGYSIVGSLVPVAIISVVATLSVLIAVVVVTATVADQLNQATFDPAAVIGPLLVAAVVSYLPTIIASILVQPFLGCFTTTYAMDLARRRMSDEPATSPEGGWQPRPYPAAPPLAFGPGGPPPGPGFPPGPATPPGSGFPSGPSHPTS